MVVPNVDLDGAELRVDRQVVLRAGRPPEFAPPKTHASTRIIPLPFGVIDVLSSHLTGFPAMLPELGPPIFTTASGELIRRKRFGEIWRGAVRRSGVRPDLTCHDLRHYYASLLIRHGESVKVVQRRLGHKTAQETLDTYGHLWADSDGRTRDAVDAELFRAVALRLAALRRAEPALPVVVRPAREISRPSRGLTTGREQKTAGERG